MPTVTLCCCASRMHSDASCLLWIRKSPCRFKAQPSGLSVRGYACAQVAVAGEFHLVLLAGVHFFLRLRSNVLFLLFNVPPQHIDLRLQRGRYRLAGTVEVRGV